MKADWKIKFEAEVEAPEPVSIWWQVVNTGDHARVVGGLRGEFFKAKTLSGAELDEPAENWEYTLYNGTHWIEAFLVRNRVIVARSGRLYVPIFNKRRRR